MGYGDAYCYAVVLKDCNVEECYELINLIEDFENIVHEELEEHRHNRDAPMSMRRRMLYDLYLKNKLTKPAKDRLSVLVRDNFALSMVADDSWHEAYAACNKINMCKVGDFMNLVHNKAWFPDYFNEFSEHMMVILHSHYDCDEEFLEGFAAKEI